MPQMPQMPHRPIATDFDDNAADGEAVYARYSDGLSLLDALGMLAFTTATTPDTYGMTEDE